MQQRIWLKNLTPYQLKSRKLENLSFSNVKLRFECLMIALVNFSDIKYTTVTVDSFNRLRSVSCF